MDYSFLFIFVFTQCGVLLLIYYLWCEIQSLIESNRNLEDKVKNEGFDIAIESYRRYKARDSQFEELKLCYRSLYQEIQALKIKHKNLIPACARLSMKPKRAPYKKRDKTSLN